MQGEQVDVYEDERGYQYWADIENEILGEENDMNTTTKCVNGILKEGDLVISTPEDEYSCLIGRVTKINLLGTPEHDEETYNETDDVHVNFFEFDYSKKRMKEIAKDFSDLYREKRKFYDCPIDDVIMAPCSLIRIIGINEAILQNLLQDRYNAAFYCYGILSSFANQTDSDNTANGDIKTHIFDVIDSALALAGYKIMDGNRDSVIIRHCASDTDYEIKINEMVL
jgi:hypothetical protein